MTIETKKIDIVCPVSGALLLVPVRLDPCGHIIERSVVENSRCYSCPVCNRRLIGYSRSAETEFKVDELARSLMVKAESAVLFPIRGVEHITRLSEVYGDRGAIQLYMARNKPYVIIREVATSNWGWLRHVIDKIFFMVCFFTTMSMSYFV